MDKQSEERWARRSLLNLLVLSLVGALLRTKAASSLPVFNYNYLLHAHSHFAFTGWVTTVVFATLLFMAGQSGVRISKTYHYLLWLNQLSAYGMLISFTCQGYGPVSIAFSALSVLVSYAFSIRYWIDAGRAAWSKIVCIAVRLALVFLLLSSAGPYLLAYSMSHPLGRRSFYYNAIYFFLHFQYNGWFSFSAIAAFLWMTWIYRWDIPASAGRWLVGLMGAACIPAFCLSLLWTDPARWIWLLAAAAGLMQLAALGVLGKIWWSARRAGSLAKMPATLKVLWAIAGLAFAIKLLLQALSAIPALGRLAFELRPVVIAYLHLVLLGFVSIFFIGFLLGSGLFTLSTRSRKYGLWLFVSGVVANEALMLVQCLFGIAGRNWEPATYLLLGSALWIAAGLIKIIS